MRRDYFTLRVTGIDGDETSIPTVTILYEGPTEQLESRLSMDEPSEVDIAYRLRDPLDSDDPMGVVGLADRITGEYVFELNAAAEDVLEFIDAARAYEKAADGDVRFRVVIETAGDEPVRTYDKSTLLVYDADGELLRGHSLLPSGVEL